MRFKWRMVGITVILLLVAPVVLAQSIALDNADFEQCTANLESPPPGWSVYDSDAYCSDYGKRRGAYGLGIANSSEAYQSLNNSQTGSITATVYSMNFAGTDWSMYIRVGGSVVDECVYTASDFSWKRHECSLSVPAANAEFGIETRGSFQVYYDDVALEWNIPPTPTPLPTPPTPDPDDIFEGGIAYFAAFSGLLAIIGGVAFAGGLVDYIVDIIIEPISRWMRW